MRAAPLAGNSLQHQSILGQNPLGVLTLDQNFDENFGLAAVIISGAYDVMSAVWPREILAAAENMTKHGQNISAQSTLIEDAGQVARRIEIGISHDSSFELAAIATENYRRLD
jgi:hypothetical protein